MTENSIINPNSVYKDTTETIKNSDKDNPKLYLQIPQNDQKLVDSESNNNEEQALRSILKVKTQKYAHLHGGEGGGGNGAGDEFDGDKESKNPVKKKKKRRDKSDLGDDFVAPDGGWGWFVAIASGINILVTFAVAQNFGIIYRKHMKWLGIDTTELTTIINIQIAVSAITGLLNGPLFRRYTFRQVAVVGSFLTFLGLFCMVFSQTFIAFVLSFSCCYGLGRGLTVSASSLAVNTYFKVRRRTATAFQFGVAGLGPIIFPFIVTGMVYYFDVEGTVLVFSGLSLHTIACSLIYQPVMWHVKKITRDIEGKNEPLPQDVEEPDTIVEPDTPTLPRANDGWYGSRSSLHSVNAIRRRSGTWEKRRDSEQQVHELKRLNSREQVNGKRRTTSITQSIKEEESEHESDTEHEHERQHLKSSDKPALKHQTSIPEHYAEDELPQWQYKSQAEIEEEDQREEEKRRKLSLWQKIIIFFDLDLLRDFGYLNLAIGITIINFVEVNFAILTPFLLPDFGFSDNETAFAMSVLGFCDLVVRFLVPVITARMNFTNKTFFIIGIAGMCLGRLLLAFTRNFYFLVAIFIWLGLNKAFRTVFWSLIIPSYVPLKRLPAAAGLQLLMSGLFSLACGPLIGLIRDKFSYAFALQFINVLAILAILMWLLEDAVKKYLNKKRGIVEENKMQE